MNGDEGGILLSIHFNAFYPYAVRISPFTKSVILILEKPDLTDFGFGYPKPEKRFDNRIQVFYFKSKAPRFRICGPRGASFEVYTKP